MKGRTYTSLKIKQFTQEEINGMSLDDRLRVAYDTWKASQDAIFTHVDYPWTLEFTDKTDPTTLRNLKLAYLNKCSGFFEFLFHSETTPAYFSEKEIGTLIKDLCDNAATIYCIRSQSLKNVLFERLYDLKTKGLLEEFPLPAVDNLSFDQWVIFYNLIFSVSRYDYQEIGFIDRYKNIFYFLNQLANHPIAFTQTIMQIGTEHQCLFHHILSNLTYAHHETLRPFISTLCQIIMSIEVNRYNKQLIAYFVNGSSGYHRREVDRTENLREMFKLMTLNMPDRAERRRVIEEILNPESLIHLFFIYRYSGWEIDFHTLSQEFLVSPIALTLKYAEEVEFVIKIVKCVTDKSDADLVKMSEATSRLSRHAPRRGLFCKSLGAGSTLVELTDPLLEKKHQ